MSAKTFSRGRAESLHVRRRRGQRRALLALSIFLLLILACGFWGLWQSSVRISHVQVYGADQSIAEDALVVMRGTYLGIIPRNSIFFIPQEAIRTTLMREHPEIAAISIYGDGFNGLAIKTIERVPVARWCGSTYSLQPNSGGSREPGTTSTPNTASTTATSAIASCYLFDAGGFIYASADATTTGQPLNHFSVYVPLAGSGSSPVGATLAASNKLPDAFDFARHLEALADSESATSTLVLSVVVGGGEVDDYLSSGTRVTYLLGSEQQAYTALSSAKADYNLSDGSVDYIDLRFPGKIYLKKKDGSVSQ